MLPAPQVKRLLKKYGPDKVAALAEAARQVPAPAAAPRHSLSGMHRAGGACSPHAASPAAREL
eukprot:SAG11_NODE_6010_length_1410_cov_2.131198_1_plen_62_part_01